MIKKNQDNKSILRNMQTRKCVYIGGKQIGANCLKKLLKFNIIPQLVIPNLDDKGKNTWHESLAKLAADKKLNVIMGKKVNDHQIINKIKNINPEIIFCIGGTQIIPEEVLKVPKLGCINIHPAMLPKYRGRYSTVQAIANGEKTTGVTLHRMDREVDSGPIISQKRILIGKGDTAKNLYDKFTKTGEELFTIFLKTWLSGEKIMATPQDPKKATFFKKELPNDGEINWNWNGKKIFNFIRAMTFEPFDPPQFKIGEKTMVIIDKKYFKGFK